MEKGKPGRPALWPEKMVASFAEGTFARIAAAGVGEKERTAFVRGAVEDKLRRVEGASQKSSQVPAAQKRRASRGT
jgi:hypothetical protein